MCVSWVQLCLTLCDPMHCSPPGSSDHGIFEARILEWVAISYSRGSSRPRDQTCMSCVSCIAGKFFTHWAIRKNYFMVCLILEKEMATHFSILAWRIPWTEEPCRLQSMGLQELDTTEWLSLLPLWLILGFPNDLSSNESACHAGDTSMGYMLPVILNINNFIN